jgi:hypothetical protein
MYLWKEDMWGKYTHRRAGWVQLLKLRATAVEA